MKIIFRKIEMVLDFECYKTDILGLRYTFEALYGDRKSPIKIQSNSCDISENFLSNSIDLVKHLLLWPNLKQQHTFMLCGQHWTIKEILDIVPPYKYSFGSMYIWTFDFQNDIPMRLWTKNWSTKLRNKQQK